jgi:hypothetical protein
VAKCQGPRIGGGAHWGPPAFQLETLKIYISANCNYLKIFTYYFSRRTAWYTLLGHKRNEEILEELHVTPLEDKLCT